jgi:hypothetical protein
VGAQETVQRWYVDDVLDGTGRDRTLRTVFTHDHFGPSTHQQAGLYAGLVTEPAGSTWRDMHTNAPLGTRWDGGPTSWKANIITKDVAESYRELALSNAGEVERIARVGYDAGERGILELLDAYRTSSVARVRQAALDVAARTAEIELEFVSGWEIR